MSIEALKNMIPDYAKDIKLNLSSLAGDETLEPQALWGCFFASALATKNATVIREIEEAAGEHLSAEAMQAAKAAAAIMAMNNVYYRFVHLASNKDYQTMQAKLRMNILANPGVDKKDFEIWSLAVSAINACGMCIDAHEQQLLKEGVSKEQIQTSVRIAATVHAVASVIAGVEAMAGGNAMQQAA